MQDNQLQNLGVALYCRVSTEEQREGQTIDSQVAELERFAREKRWTVADIYKDEGWSGSLLARPALDQLRDHAHQGRFQVVLVNDVDRLARDVSHLGIVKRDLESRGVQVVFRKLPGEQSPTHNLLVNILGSFAEFERELIADRTRRGRRHKVEVRKQHVGALPPYGFKYIPKLNSTGEPGHLEVLPDEAAIVRRMYMWVDQHSLSIEKVAARLNAAGIRPRKGGRQWQKSSVRRILRSEVYAGVWHYNKHLHCEPLRPSPRKYRKSLRTSLRLRARTDWIPVPLPAELRIINRSLWNRVQQQIDRNIVLSTRNTRHFYLLRGFLRCGGCKGAYVGDPSHGRFAYRCINRCKRYPSIHEDFLNDTVWSAVKECLENPDLVGAGIKGIVRYNQGETESGVEHDRRALEQIQAEETRIVQAYRLGVFTAEQLGIELTGLQARKALVNRSKPNQAMTVGIETVCRSLQDYRQHISARLEILNQEQRREILQHLLTRIIFNGEQVTIIGRVAVPTNGLTAIAPNTPSDPTPEFDDTNVAAHARTSNITGTTSWDHARNADRIGGTTSWDHARNADRIAGTTSWDHARNCANQIASDEAGLAEVTFEFVARVHRDRTAAIAARKANLLKASATRWKRNTV
jgi:site-specific DNA recombinase